MAKVRVKVIVTGIYEADTDDFDPAAYGFDGEDAIDVIDEMVREDAEMGAIDPEDLEDVDITTEVVP